MRDPERVMSKSKGAASASFQTNSAYPHVGGWFSNTNVTYVSQKKQRNVV